MKNVMDDIRIDSLQEAKEILKAAGAEFSSDYISVATLLNTILVLFIKSDELLEICYSMANIFGNSFIVDLYFLVCSRKMCIWYKLNILCLSGTHIIGIAYNVLLIDESLYLLAVIILSMLGIAFFLIYRKYYKTIF